MIQGRSELSRKILRKNLNLNSGMVLRVANFANSGMVLRVAN